MHAEPPAPIRGKCLEALRACALYPRGMRHEAHPSAMSVLEAQGYVEQRPTRFRRGRARWYITPAGRDLLATLGEKVGSED